MGKPMKHSDRAQLDARTRAVRAVAERMAAASAAPEGAEPLRSVGDLEARVRRLEDAVRNLEAANFGGAPVIPPRYDASVQNLPAGPYRPSNELRR